MSSYKEHVMELEQQLMIAKQRSREAVEELEEVKTQLLEQNTKIDDYRIKVIYLNFYRRKTR
jgi:phosphoribosylformylglycinamidine (FGAM) synthase PurS component